MGWDGCDGWMNRMDGMDGIDGMKFTQDEILLRIYSWV